MKRPHRGVSFGTVFMLSLTVLVLGSTAAIFPRLLGNADLRVAADSMIAALTLHDGLPELALSDIPISDALISNEDQAVSTVAIPTVAPVLTPVPTATPAPGGTVRLTFGGSVNIDDSIRKSAYYSDSGKYDFVEIMALLRDEMQTDLTMLTLENTAVDAEKVSSLNAPSAVMDMLESAGVDVLALGFPKAMDKGINGLTETVEAAQQRGMTVIGAYVNQADADQLRMFTVDNVDVAFLHYTEAVSAAGQKQIRETGASYAVPAVNLNGTLDAMLTDVGNARKAGADVIVVSLNWGKLSASKPTNAQKDIAQQLSDAGADVIIGAGTRVVQPVTWLTSKNADGNIRHTLCAWNLGSLLNESRKDGNVLGMLLQLQISYDGNAISFERVCYTPTYIWRYKQDGQYQYRIAVSDQPAPDGMSDDQTGYMEKAYRNLQKYLGDSPVTLRQR